MKIVCSLIAALVGCALYFWLPFRLLENSGNATSDEGFHSLPLNLALASLVIAGIAFEISQHLLKSRSK